MGLSLYWLDYETFGADTRRDRPAQFAGIRTDLNLEVIEEPLNLYCRPSNDFLPHPEACLITGITPQQALADGVSEAEFMKRIHRELARPGTCSVGYNTIRFDDEITRNTLYRNLHDPYEREWKNGNSRWDLINVARMAAALRPDGIYWPRSEDGKPSFKLEKLAAANGLSHDSAHDALSDVRATIALARLIRERQPKLFEFAYATRGKKEVEKLITLGKPIVHVDSSYPAENGYLAVVVPLARHPTNPNGYIVYNLSKDPSDWIGLDAETLRERIFARQEHMSEGVARVALKNLQINKCPAIANYSTLRPQDAERLNIDLSVCRQHLEALTGDASLFMSLAATVRKAFEEPESKESDPDLMLYSGAFFNDADKRQMQTIHRLSPEQLANHQPHFVDPRLSEMLFRYRARNFPETLSVAEHERWDAFRLHRLTTPDTGFRTIDEYNEHLNRLEQEALNMENEAAGLEQWRIVKALRKYGIDVMNGLFEPSESEPMVLSA